MQPLRLTQVGMVGWGRSWVSTGAQTTWNAALMFAAMESAETGQPIITLRPLSV